MRRTDARSPRTAPAPTSTDRRADDRRADDRRADDRRTLAPCAPTRRTLASPGLARPRARRFALPALRALCPLLALLALPTPALASPGQAPVTWPEPDWPEHEIVLPERLVHEGGEGCFWLHDGSPPPGFPALDPDLVSPLERHLPEVELEETDRTWDPEGLRAEGQRLRTDRWFCATLPFLFRSRSTHESILEGRARLAEERTRLGHPPLERTTVLYESGIETTHPIDPDIHEPGPASAWAARRFTVDDPERFASISVELQFAGGAILYLNGHEIVRHNVPEDLADDSLASIRETPPWFEETANNRWQRTTLALDPALLQPGENLLSARLLRRPDGGMRAMFFDVILDGYTEHGMTRSPYLQSPTDTAVTVRWETSFPALGAVEVRDEHSGETRTVHASGPASTRHEIRLEGLRPDTRHAYRTLSIPDPNPTPPLVAPGDPLVSRERSFITGTPDPNQPFSFIAYGDNRTRGDRHEEVVRSMWRTARQHDPRFVIHGGDMTTTGSPRDEWHNEFFLPALPLMGFLGFYTVIGNHERNHESYYDVFSQPGNETFFRQRLGSIDLFVINVDYTVAPSSDQVRWLDRALAESTAPWRIVAIHHPPFSCPPGRKPGHRGVRAHLVPLFVAHSVDLVIGSHDHLYGRTRVIDGVQYVTTGGGGAPTYPFQEDEDNIICIRRLHHLLIHVSPERLEVIAIASDDEELDRFTVERDITRTAQRLPIRLDRLLRGRFFGESADAIYPMGTGHDSSEP